MKAPSQRPFCNGRHMLLLFELAKIPMVILDVKSNQNYCLLSDDGKVRELLWYWGLLLGICKLGTMSILVKGPLIMFAKYIFSTINTVYNNPDQRTEELLPKMSNSASKKYLDYFQARASEPETVDFGSLPGSSSETSRTTNQVGIICANQRPVLDHC